MRLRIQELCGARDMSMRGLGRRIGMEISVLSRINTGRMCPSIAVVDRIASALGCDYNSLIESTEDSRHRMDLYTAFEQAEGADPGLSPLERVRLADEKGRELLLRRGDVDLPHMEIKTCF